MSAVEEIQRAIETLTEIKSLPPLAVTFNATDNNAMNAWFERAEAKLAMFHRTIDAQLAILKLELEICDEGCTPAPQFLTLARAINGDAS